jgi:type IV secretory pathway TraG/TraD family ATPase VirD4
MALAEQKKKDAEYAVAGAFVGALVAGLVLLLLAAWPLETLIRGVPPAHFTFCRDAARAVTNPAYAGCRPGLSYAWLQNSWTYYETLFSQWDAWWMVLYDTFLDPLGSFLMALDGDLPSPVLLLFFAPLPFAFHVWSRRFRDLRLQGEGGAYFATEDELAQKELFYKSGMVLGRMNRPSWLARAAMNSTMFKPLAPYLGRPKYIRNWESLSGILVSPPGTGKTLTLLTNVLADWPDDARIPCPSMFMSDPKGEIYGVSAGWRSRFGPVFRLAWGELDGDSWNPLDPSSFKDGLKRGPVRKKLLEALKALFDMHNTVAIAELFVLMRDSSDWKRKLAADPALILPEVVIPPDLREDNPADVGHLAGWAAQAATVRRAREAARNAFKGQRPEILAACAKALEVEPTIDATINGLIRVAEELAGIYGEAEKAIDNMCAILIPETVEQHWRITGREALSGFIGFVMARAEQFPDIGEPTFGYLLDWLTGTAKDPKVGYADLDEADLGTDAAPTGGDAKEGEDDMTAKLLDEAIAEAVKFGYPSRVISDLRALRMKPDRERGSVVSTAAGSISIFKNAIARARTAHSTFRTADARGVKDPVTGKIQPVTVYCIVNVAEAEAYGRITGLLVESLAQILLSEEDAAFSKAKKDGSTRHVMFMLDEFWTLPALKVLRQIPALGRGLWCSALVIGQTFAQISSKYGNDGKNALQELKAASGYQMFCTQNDLETAKEASEILGQVTVIAESTSKQVGFGQNVSMFSSNLSLQSKGRALLRPEEIMRLEKITPAKNIWGEILVRFGDVNMLVKPACYFDDPVIGNRARLKLEDRKRWKLPCDAPPAWAAAPANANVPGSANVVSATIPGGLTPDERLVAAAMLEARQKDVLRRARERGFAGQTG